MQTHQITFPLPFIGSDDIHHFDYEDGDDHLAQGAALRPEELKKRVLRSTWLRDMLAGDWPGHSDSPYVNAYAAVAQVILVAVAVESTHSEDIAAVLNLQEAFVLAVLAFLEAAEWKDTLLPALATAIQSNKGYSASEIVTTFLTENAAVKVSFMDTLKVLGLGL